MVVAAALTDVRVLMISMMIFFFVILADRNQSFRQQLDLAGHRCRDRRIPRITLQDPNSSPWVRLFCSNSEQALITFTGLDYRSFNYLNTKFKPLFERYTPYSSSGKIRLRRVVNGVPVICRPLSLDSHGCLGLVCVHLLVQGGRCMLYNLRLV